MTSQQRPPRFEHRPIRSQEALARRLGIPLDTLLAVAAIANTKYRLAKPIIKPDGSIRQPFDALEPLKSIHRRIKERILDRVIFPDYLTGSLRGRDAKKNAGFHVGAAIVICEDVSGFFPSTSAGAVNAIWSDFFRFSPDVATLLTLLTTKDGALPQGAITSSHLANLAFWRDEHPLYERFLAEGIAYSRYVDDVTVSSKRRLSNAEVEGCIACIYSMMGRNSYRPKRSKQEIQRANSSIFVTKLLANRRAALPSRERKAIRAAVYQLEKFLEEGDVAAVIQGIGTASGRVNRLSQLHPTEGAVLKDRITSLRRALKLQP